MQSSILALLILISTFSAQVTADERLGCQNLLTHSSARTTEIEPQINLRILTLNTQGFRIHQDLSEKQKAKPKHQRYLKKIASWAATVADIDPDITILQEVFSDYEIEYLISEHLNDEYDYFYMPGNDSYNNIAFLVKKGLPLNYKFRSHKNLNWKNKALFTRDAPMLIIESSITGKVFTSIIGHHAKAGKNDQSNPFNEKLRTRQNVEILNIAKRTSDEFSDIPVIAAGDFNANLHDDPSTAELTANMIDVFDLLARPPPQERRVTFSYFKNNTHIQDQLDGIVVYNSEKVQIRRADVYRYRDENGNEYPLPETLTERRKLPSDHNPVFADFRFSL